MTKGAKTIFFTLLFTPCCVSASVSISEVAWMGIAGANGQFGEWIELSNDGPLQDLSGWKLYSAGGSDLVFTLSKTISAQGYLVIERTTASMLDPVPGVDDEQGSFGAGGLSNEGEYLVLKDTNGTTIDSINAGAGWPAGDATTKDTMQRKGSSWVTARATPGQGLSTTEDPPGDETDIETTTPSPVASSNKKQPLRYVPTLSLEVPSELYQYVEHKFSADVVLEDGLHHKSGFIFWNMGDGTVIKQDFLEPVSHRYLYPGTYTLWFGYYKSRTDSEPYLFTTKRIRVGSPILSINKISTDAVEITNQSDTTVDLSQWQVVSGQDRGVIPPFTFLAPEASIALSAGSLGLSRIDTVGLARPLGELLAPHRESSVAGVSTEMRMSQVPDDPEVKEGEESLIGESSEIPGTKRNRTKQIVFGAISTILVALFILLERAMAKRE